jgi:hypothetical protein
MRSKPRQGEQGMALLAALMMVFIFSLLAMASLQFANQETVGAKAMHDDHMGRHAAEAAIQLVVNWFHEPASLSQMPGAQLFSKRGVDAHGQPTFFDSQGLSQFKGTAAAPDLLLDAGNPQHDELMNNPQTGWFRSMRGLARILRLKVYGPVHPGLLCTVEVIAASGQGETAKNTASVEFGTYSIPSLTSAVQTAGFKPSLLPDAVVPILVHWGDLKADGDVVLLSEREVPEKTNLASVTGQSYQEMDHRQDRWFDLIAGGKVIFTRPVPGGNEISLQNVHQEQEPMPGLKMDRWRYEALKALAMSLGTYYVMDREGHLHPGGTVQPGQGLLPDDVLASHAVGEHRGLVFVDTLDQQPPRLDNMGTLTLNTEYLEGLFVLNAHVLWHPKESMKTLPALSPPPEDKNVLGLRTPAQLTGINLRGVIYAAGNITYCGKPRIYGGLLVDGVITTCPNQDAVMEVWYDFDLKDGLHRGVPVVYVVPGTWQNKS